MAPPPCSFTPTQAPCHRQAPVTHAESHRDTSAPTQACQLPTAPQRPVVGGQHTGAVPTQPPAPPRAAGMGGHTHPSTTQPLARVGTRAVGAVLSAALAQLLAVALQPGFGRSRTTAGISRAPTTHTRCTRMHMCSSAHACKDSTACMSTRVPAHTRSLCTARPPHLPQPHFGVPGLPGPVGSTPCSDGPHLPFPRPLCDPHSTSTTRTRCPPHGLSPTRPPGSPGLILRPDPPIPGHPEWWGDAQGAAACGGGRWGGKSGGTGGMRGKGDCAGQQESHRLQPEQQAAAVAPREGVPAAAALTWQRSPGQGSICSAGHVN